MRVHPCRLCPHVSAYLLPELFIDIRHLQSQVSNSSELETSQLIWHEDRQCLLTCCDSDWDVACESRRLHFRQQFSDVHMKTLTTSGVFSSNSTTQHKPTMTTFDLVWVLLLEISHLEHVGRPCVSWAVSKKKVTADENLSWSFHGRNLFKYILSLNYPSAGSDWCHVQNQFTSTYYI